MATVDGITAARAQEIEDASVVSGHINLVNGHLILETHDGTEIDAGLVSDVATMAGLVTDVNELQGKMDDIYPIAGDGVWHSVGAGGGEPAFASNISNFGSPYEAVRFRRDNGIVRLQGLAISSVTTAVQDLFTLPSGFRPAGSIILVGNSNLNSGAASTGTAHTHVLSSMGVRIQITSAGLVQVNGVAAFQATPHISLSGITFCID